MRSLTSHYRHSCHLISIYFMWFAATLIHWHIFRAHIRAPLLLPFKLFYSTVPRSTSPWHGASAQAGALAVELMAFAGLAGFQQSQTRRHPFEWWQWQNLHFPAHLHTCTLAHLCCIDVRSPLSPFPPNTHMPRFSRTQAMCDCVCVCVCLLAKEHNLIVLMPLSFGKISATVTSFNSTLVLNKLENNNRHNLVKYERKCHKQRPS